MSLITHHINQRKNIAEYNAQKKKRTKCVNVPQKETATRRVIDRKEMLSLGCRKKKSPFFDLGV